METELNSLEQKLNQVVDLCHRLRTDNQQLRQQLASALSDNKHLAEKIDTAGERLEILLQQLPEGEA
jgi:cell division protein ZapB